MTTELLTCEACEAPNAQQVGLRFLCLVCAEAAGICPRCLRDEAEVDAGDERVCVSCADAARDADGDLRWTEMFEES